MITLFVWSSKSAPPRKLRRFYKSANHLPRKFRPRAGRRYEVTVNGIGNAPPHIVGKYVLRGPFQGQGEHTGKSIRVTSEDYDDMLYLLHLLWRYPESAAVRYYRAGPGPQPQKHD